MTDQEYYFNMGVEIGRDTYHSILKGDSYLASRFTLDHADKAMKKAFKQFNIILPHQDMIKRGIRMGVLTSGTQQRREHANI